MNAIIEEALTRIARSLAFLWYHSEKRGNWIELFFYDGDLSVQIRGKRVKVRIEIEDNPHWQKGADDDA